MPTVMTLHAGHVMMQRDPFPHLESPNFLADTNNGSAGLMSKHSRWRHRSVMDLFDVRRAHTTSSNLYQQIAGTNFRHRQYFQAQVIHTPVNNRFHRLWNAIHPTKVTD